MSTTGTRWRPTLDELEPRRALSSNALADSLGTVPTPHSVGEVSVPITAQSINNRHSIVLGTSTEPTAGSGLDPTLAVALGPGGRHLPLRRGAPFVPGKHGSATAFVRDGTPGPLTLGLTGRRGTTGPFRVQTYLPGDITGDHQVTLDDLKAFTQANLTTSHDALYNPAADANRNGFIGRGDGQFLVRNLRPLTPKIPLKVDLTLAPEDQVHGHVSSNSGGHTDHERPTILGHTTPGSLVFTDSGLGDYTFTGPALYADQNGNFSFRVQNREGLNNFEFLVIDPYGQQTIRAFPIFWIPFAAKGSTLK
ncbi:MAG: hypothetical protein ACM35G_02030 [Planctomycetaceae bacterium]